MTAEELIRAGKPAEALAALQQSVRENPADARLRVFLFQLLCVLGKWEKAMSQLAVLRDLDADCLLLAQIFAPAVQCEIYRAEVFAGRRSPLIFGEPEQWIGMLVQANQLVAEGQFAAAANLRAQAFDLAPSVAGTINGEAFEWIADADSRLGPLLEVVLNGKYYWVPFSQIRSIRIEAPADLRDLVWTNAQFAWRNEGESPGLIPTRYPGSEAEPDSAIQMGRKTVWRENPGETFLGLGLRTFATDSAEISLHEIRSVDFGNQTNVQPSQ